MKKEALNEEIEITDINNDGSGVGKTSDGKVVFVKGAVTGDIVKADVIKRTRGYDVCSVSEYVKLSPIRIEGGCKYKSRCGGCIYSDISYQAELEQKEKLVYRLLRKVIPEAAVAEKICSDTMTHYRNKVAYPVGYKKDNTLGFGYYAPHSHDIIFHDSCLLQDDNFAKIAEDFLKAAQGYKLTPYNEATGKGILRHLLMRKNSKNEYMLCVVVNSNALPFSDMLSEELVKLHPEVKLFAYSSNEERTNVITGNTYNIIYGESITDTLCGKKFTLSPLSFYQVNRDMAELLYIKAAEYAGECKILLDLYCGIGSIGIAVAKETTMLCGVEIVPEAVADAKKNAMMNNRTDKNTLFICGDAATGVAECKKRFGAPEVIIVDPPRKGLSPETIREILKARPERLVYISCDPATLARDLAVFSGDGYIVNAVAPFDLFPRTAHVECVVLMSRAV